MTGPLASIRKASDRAADAARAQIQRRLDGWFVFLDGFEVKHVVAVDVRSGWIDVEVHDDDGNRVVVMGNDFEPRLLTSRLHGVVRVAKKGEERGSGVFVRITDAEPPPVMKNGVVT